MQRKRISGCLGVAVGYLILVGCGAESDLSAESFEPVADSIPQGSLETNSVVSANPDAVLETDLSELPAPYNEADYDAGKRIFRQCAACHGFTKGIHLTGPSLFDVFGQKAGSIDGFKYSDALQSSELIWTVESMDEWLAQPNKKIPNNAMNYAGLRRESQRQDLIAYMLIESEGVSE